MPSVRSGAAARARNVSANASAQAEKEKLTKAYEDEFMTPYIAAERGYMDEVILPEETRSKIRSAFEALKLKDRKAAGYREHGNIPL